MCVRLHLPGRVKTTSAVTNWGSVTSQILALSDRLIAEQVTLVVMEAIGDFWKSFYYLPEEGPFEIMLVNPRHVKNLPDRKAAVSDAAWLAELGAHGLIRGSFIPPPNRFEGCGTQPRRAPPSCENARERFNAWRSSSRTRESNSRRSRRTCTGLGPPNPRRAGSG